jgi:Carbohydrate binding module (family 6)/Fibronectin type III domain
MQTNSRARASRRLKATRLLRSSPRTVASLFEPLDCRRYLAASGLVYSGDRTPDASVTQDGGVPPAVGVQLFQIVRSAPGNTAASDGKAWIYRHAPYLAYWQGKFWNFHHGSTAAEADSEGKLHWSADGMTWNTSDSGVVFPDITHQRSSFYVSSSGRMLVTAWVGRGAAFRGQEGTRIVREVYGPGSYGPILAAKYNVNGAWNSSLYPLYTTSSDAGFKTSVAQMLSDKLYRQQWQEEDRDSSFYVVNSVPNDSGGTDPAARAFNWWQTADGRIAATWKGPISAVANSWDFGQVAPQLESYLVTQPYPNGYFVGSDQLGLHGSAKIWGQRTESGGYLVVGDAPGVYDRRTPAVISTSRDGLNFTTPYVGFGAETPPLRYENTQGTFDNKDYGTQYFTGITPATSVSPGNGNAPGDETWIVYSVNKEDIWIAKIPAVVREAVTGPVADNFDGITPGKSIPDWNTSSIQWGDVRVAQEASGNRFLRLEDRDPVLNARAFRVFDTATGTATVSYRVRPGQNNSGKLEMDVVSANGDSPVRLVLDSTGKLMANNGSTMMQIGTYTPGTWLDITLSVEVSQFRYSVTVNNGTSTQVFANRGLRQAVSSVERVEFRTGDSTREQYDRRPFNGGWTTTRIANADVVQTNAVFDIDDFNVSSTRASVETRDDWDPKLRYTQGLTNGWLRSNAASGSFRSTTHSSDKLNATMWFTFEGTGFEILGHRAANNGRFDVFIDGATTPVATIDSYSSVAQSQQVLYAHAGLSPGTHLVKVVVRSDKSAASTGRFTVLDRVNISAAAATSAPQAPTALRAYAASATSVVLAWQDNADTESGYVVERSLDAAFSTVTVVATTQVSQATFTDVGLTTGTIYYYRVRSVNTAGQSLPSNTASTRPFAGPYPFGVFPKIVSGTASSLLEAEEYDLGGPGIAYLDSDATNNGNGAGNTYRTTEQVDIGNDAAASGGRLVGWTEPGEWLAYTVEVAVAGTYHLDIQYNSGGPGGTLRVEVGTVGQVGGGLVLAPVNLAGTGNWSGNFQTIRIANVPLSAGVQWIRLVHVTGGYNLDRIVATPVDVTAPAVSTKTFTYDTEQAMAWTFTEDVSASLGLDDFTLTNLTSNSIIPDSSLTLSYDSLTNTATIRPSGSFILPDGRYALTINNAGVTDQAGINLMASDSLAFGVLAGDANGDGFVNFSDLLALAQNYSQLLRSFASGDFNYDGQINFSDLLILAQNYGVSLPPPSSLSLAVQLDHPASTIAAPPSGAVATRPPGAALSTRRRTSWLATS